MRSLLEQKDFKKRFICGTEAYERDGFGDFLIYSQDPGGDGGGGSDGGAG